MTDPWRSTCPACRNPLFGVPDGAWVICWAFHGLTPQHDVFALGSIFDDRTAECQARMKASLYEGRGGKILRIYRYVAPERHTAAG